MTPNDLKQNPPNRLHLNREPRRGGFWPQRVDQPRNLPEQVPRHRHLGRLERNVAAVLDRLRRDLDQLHARRGILMTTERTDAEGRLRLMPQQIVVYPSVTGKSVYATVPWWM